MGLTLLHIRSTFTSVFCVLLTAKYNKLGSKLQTYRVCVLSDPYAETR